MTACEKCAIGSYSDMLGAELCSMCKYGEYASVGASAVSMGILLKNGVFLLTEGHFTVLTVPWRELEHEHHRLCCKLH